MRKFMNENVEKFLCKVVLGLDHIIIPLRIEWKHNYKREKVQLYPSVEFCKELQEVGADINHDTAYLDYFDWVLFDGKDVVLKYGCRGFDNDQDLIDSTDAEFIQEMDRYIESHKYFSLYLWLNKKLHPLELDPEHIK